MKRLALIGLLASCAIFGISAERKALVIGEGDYADSPLLNPANDARDMNAALRDLGFGTIILVDAGRSSILAGIEQFVSGLKPGDTALFYFSGHGCQVRGANYLIPVDGDIKSADEVSFKAIPLDLVLGRLDEAGSATNIVILDACRNNPFPGSERSASRGLANATYPIPGTLVVFSTAPGAVSADGDSRNGTFTRRLLGRLGTPGIDIESMLRLVRDDVIADTQGVQVPWSNSSLRGPGFSFVPLSSPASSVTAAASAQAVVTAAPASPWTGTMVTVPAGTFTMGSSTGDQDELPLHEVKLGTYLISAYETTWADYKRFCEATAKPFPSDPRVMRPQFPASFLTWFDACEYCDWLSTLEGYAPAYILKRNEAGAVTAVEWDRSADGYRLPTEAEWEYAARGGAVHSTARFAGGDDLNAIAWHKGDSGGSTWAVGTKDPNALGLYDMSGNVWEWCWDWYGPYADAPSTEPIGPASGKVRILRGGGYNTATVAYYSVSNRGTSAPVRSGSDIGFRVARTPTAESGK